MSKVKMVPPEHLIAEFVDPKNKELPSPSKAQSIFNSPNDKEPLSPMRKGKATFKSLGPATTSQEPLKMDNY